MGAARDAKGEEDGGRLSRATRADALGLDRPSSKGDLEDAQSSGRIRTLGTPVDATPRLCLRLLLEVGRASRVIITAPPASSPRQLLREDFSPLCRD